MSVQIELMPDPVRRGLSATGGITCEQEALITVQSFHTRPIEITVLDQMPGAILPDEILTPGAEQVRALFVTAGNPVLSCANESRMREALESLELLVCIDLFRNETGQLAHYVLPGLSFLERSDIPLGAQGFMSEPYLQHTPAVVQPDGQQRHEWWIFRELAHAVGVPLMGLPGADAWRTLDRGLRRLPVLGDKLAFHPDQLYAGMIAATGQTTLGGVQKHPHGRPLRRKPTGDFLPGRLLTADKRVDLAPPDLLAAGHSTLTVLDLSEAALSAARQRLGERAQRVDWRLGDITQLELPRHAYALWHDRAVFHFLTTREEREAYVAAVLHAVKPGGHVIVATFAEDGPLKCSGLPVMRYSADGLHAEFGAPFALLQQEGEEHHTPRGTVQKFVYCLCRREPS